jgi:hypothetical protein
MQMFVPVQGKGAWWCYALDLRDNTLFIIDPSVDNHDSDYVLSKHHGTINLVLDSLKSTIQSLFDGWQLPSDDFDHVVVSTTLTGCSRFVLRYITLKVPKNYIQVLIQLICSLGLHLPSIHFIA